MINLSSMFAKSPFKPLRDHMDKVVESVAPLKDFFDALHQGNYSKVEEIQQQISLAEEEADIIKNEVRNHTACAMAFAHGSNDVANGIGPMAAIVSIVESGAKWPRNQICHFGFY